MNAFDFARRLSSLRAFSAFIWNSFLQKIINSFWVIFHWLQPVSSVVYPEKGVGSEYKFFGFRYRISCIISLFSNETTKISKSTADVQHNLWKQWLNRNRIKHKDLKAMYLYPRWTAEGLEIWFVQRFVSELFNKKIFWPLVFEDDHTISKALVTRVY